MNTLKSLILVTVSLFMCVVIAGCQGPAAKSDVIVPAGKTLTVGDKVRLFHSGGEDIKKIFCIGDVVPVYKEAFNLGMVQRTEVGMVKVVSYEGKQAILAQVVSGTVKAGNIAEKEATACMVYLPETE